MWFKRTPEKDTMDGIKWIGAQYKYLQDLQTGFDLLSKTTDTKLESEFLKMGRRLLKYVGRCERKAERYIAPLKQELKQPELQAILEKAEVPRAQLVNAFSFYVGSFKNDLQRGLRILALKQASKDSEKKAQADALLKKMLERSAEKINVLTRWTGALQAALVELENAEVDLKKRNLLRTGSAAAVLPTLERAAVVGAKILGGVSGTLTAVSEARAGKMPDITLKLSPANKRRPRRPYTRFIVLHTTEGNNNGWVDVYNKGTANYVVLNDGSIYNTIQIEKLAMHAGRSMWDNLRNMDNYSIGIEVVGFHDKSLTKAQHSAIGKLVNLLQSIYNIPDEKVLCHSMVAYGAPNRYHRKSHRGRKRCAMNMGTVGLRSHLGITKKTAYDPDVRAGRLVVADPTLANILWGDGSDFVSEPSKPPKKEKPTPGKPKPAPKPKPEPVKPLPPPIPEEEDDVWHETKLGETAFRIAQDEYAAETTIYFFPSGIVRTGAELMEGKEKFKLTNGEVVDSKTYFLKYFPLGTKVLVGYIYGGFVTKERSALEIAGGEWNFPSTFYYPTKSTTKKLVSGDDIDPKTIPLGTLVFFRN